MNIILRILEKIGTGMAYGVGIGIVIFAIGFLSSVYYTSEIEREIYGDSDPDECSDFQDCEESSGLVLEITKEKIDSEDFVLLGKISNTGDIKWTSVKVRAELFDSNGEFIDECSETVDRSISPGSEVNFKLSCTQCSKIDLDDYKSYKAFIVGGHNW